MKRSHKPRTNAEISESTIESLLSRARHEFASLGYAKASMERIASEGGMTKGAIYYHFKSKKGLFEAVLEDCHREITQRIETQAFASSEPKEALINGCLAFLDVAMDAALRQIVLVDGPGVLGYEQWRRIDAKFGLGSLKEGLKAWAGDDPDIDVEILAHFISGALNDLVLFVSESSNRAQRHESVSQHLPEILTLILSRSASSCAIAQ